MYFWKIRFNEKECLERQTTKYIARIDLNTDDNSNIYSYVTSNI
jgi:hypothetical protein